MLNYNNNSSTKAMEILETNYNLRSVKSAEKYKSNNIQGKESNGKIQ